MDCVTDGVSLPQTYLTGHAKEEVLRLQIRGLRQITPLETVETITLQIEMNSNWLKLNKKNSSKYKAKCPRAKILTKRVRCSVWLEMSNSQKEHIELSNILKISVYRAYIERNTTIQKLQNLL